jgi:hypothetical protein
MAEAVLLLFALLALGSPPVSICFALAAIGTSVWRQYRLRKELNELREESYRQADLFGRELADLRQQLRNTAVTGLPKVEPAGASDDQSAWTTEGSSKAETPLVSVTPVVEPAAVQLRIDLAKVAELRATPPLTSSAEKPEPDQTDRVPSSSTTEPATPPTVPTEASVSSFVPAESIPTSQVSDLPGLPEGNQALAGFFQTRPHTSPREVVAAATDSAETHLPETIPTSRPTFQQRMKAVSGLEETLGTNWLNKLGIIILVLGVALFGIYELGELGPLGKAGLSYIAGAVLLGGGILLEKRERYRILGRTGIGGGWALLFFTSYALNHVQAMRVLESETADLILMLLVAGAMVAHTLRYNSQLVTGLAFLLAYTTVALSHDNVYSLSAGVILAIGLVSIVVRRGWFELEVFGILSSYLNHFYWLYHLLGPGGAAGQQFPEYHASTALLLFYWSAFRVSYIVRTVKSVYDEDVSTAAALLNTLMLLGVMKFQSVHPELAFLALLAVGGVEFACGQLPVIRKRREAFVVLTVLGAALMIAAVPFHYSGNNVVILWLIGGETLLIAGVAADEVVFRRLGLLGGLLAGSHFIGIEFVQLMAIRRSAENLALAIGVVFAICAVVFYVNALFIGTRWKQFFDTSPDRQLLITHCYLAAFAAAASAWALFGKDWTAPAFALVMLIVAALCYRLQSTHLRIQYCAVGVLSLYRVFVVNLHTESPPHSHITLRLLTLPLLSGAFYLVARMSRSQDESEQDWIRALFAASGTMLIALLIFFEVPELWQPLAAISFAAMLYQTGALLSYRALTWHTHALTLLAMAASLNADRSGEYRWHDMPVHAFTALPVVAGAYWLAKRMVVTRPDDENVARVAYSWAATGLMAWVIEEAMHTPWVAVGWIAFAVLLAVAGRWIHYKHFGWQASAVALSAVVWTGAYSFSLEQKLWDGVSTRLITVALVAAGLYAISRKASAPDTRYRGQAAFLHTATATTLLALLAWYEAPGGWLAPAWALFALVLTLADRFFGLDDLGWQAHALAALALFRSFTVNLHVTDRWRGISLRLLTLAFVAIVFYVLSRIARMAEEWRTRDFHHVYSWAASTLVSTMVWYELQPLSIAVAWAVFGVVLFEYSLQRNVRQFRYQSYVVFVAAFIRIFFANLTVSPAEQFWGPRIYTVLPLALIFFFVYTQLATQEQAAAGDRRLHFDTLVAYLGTGTIVALAYFQFPMDWVVTAWAVVVFSLLAAAQLTGRVLFLYQGLLLSVGVLSRGLIHNLFGASYFTGSDWTGRYVVLASAIVILFLTLPFAFGLRDRETKNPTSTPSWRKVAEIVARRPEQLMFFVPTILLTLMLALKMRAGMVTVSWGIEGVLIVLLALLAGERSYRLTGLFILLACVAKIMLRDAWGLAPRDRYVTFIILGAALLLVSFLYTKYRDTMRQFL